ncbi:MAG: hypothetical protein IIY93_08510 [Clostridia bacterium]|nr:hypothetical protein [Clostridia bacterium]MBQ5545243.1 hypothetical protein [Clostridia bacterium]
MKARIMSGRRMKEEYIPRSEVSRIIGQTLDEFAACCAAAQLLSMDETPGIGHKRMSVTARNYTEWMKIFGEDASDGALRELIYKRLSERGLLEIFAEMGYDIRKE